MTVIKDYALNLEYIGAAGVLPPEVLPEGIRMVSVVWRCICAARIAFEVEYDDLRESRDVQHLLARHMLVRLLEETTHLSAREIERALRLGHGAIWRTRKALPVKTAPAVEAAYMKLVDVYNEMVQFEYDREIPF